jgi:hypothetical protein
VILGFSQRSVSQGPGGHVSEVSQKPRHTFLLTAHLISNLFHLRVERLKLSQNRRRNLKYRTSG